MATAAVQARATRRQGERHGVRAPLDVTVLRSGIPDTLPGRLVNVGERGIAAVLAGELLPGESVGVEIRLPAANLLRARAVVRHHDRLKSGMEFVGLTLEQRTALRSWAGALEAQPEARERGAEKKIEATGEQNIADVPAAKVEECGLAVDAPLVKRRGRRWILWAAAALLLAGGLWWKWDRGWKDLEPELRRNEAAIKGIGTARQVPAEAMQRLVTHRVDPEYPSAARAAQLRGVIAVEMVVGRDGSVVSLRPLNGPDVLAQAATEALRWWRFEPYEINGKPVAVKTEVAVEFKP